MKENLKTRPTLANGLSPGAYYMAIDKWFRDITDEIREIVKECRIQLPLGQGKNVKIHLQSRMEAFKEMLGE